MTKKKFKYRQDKKILLPQNPKKTGVISCDEVYDLVESYKDYDVDYTFSYAFNCIGLELLELKYLIETHRDYDANQSLVENLKRILGDCGGKK